MQPRRRTCRLNLPIYQMRLLRLMSCLLLGLIPLFSAEAPKTDDASVAELAAVAADLKRFEMLLNDFNDERYKPRIVEALETLRKRAEGLRANFDQQKSDDLRFDINQQAQRLARYRQPLITPPRRAADLQLTALDPDPARREEVVAALVALDREIARQAAQLPAVGMTGRATREERLARVRSQRAELDRKFTREGWAEITRALKAE